MAKRHFLQKAHTLNKTKHSVAGRFASEKLDGIRFFWDGGVTRGLPIEQVPWANIRKSNPIPISTGLWSNYAKPFNAPDWWLDKLPYDFPLEGELYIARGQFQLLSSIVRSTVNQKDWKPVRAMVFDTPDLVELFNNGTINNTHYKITFKSILQWFRGEGGLLPHSGQTFRTRYNYLKKNLQENSVVELHEQHILPFSTPKAFDEIERLTDSILELGGEGLMIKAANNLWLPERSYGILKYKPWLDAEAQVVGYTWGEETDKGSKLKGLMGALICEIPAGKFKLSGFTNAERILIDGKGDDAGYAWEPGKIVSSDFLNPKFERQSIITYKYRELTDDGLPKEARYWR